MMRKLTDLNIVVKIISPSDNIYQWKAGLNGGLEFYVWKGTYCPTEEYAKADWEAFASINNLKWEWAVA